jgi:type IV secretory pathway ATPase VirB11/archaellum biosynthesis ATPase
MKKLYVALDRTARDIAGLKDVVAICAMDQGDPKTILDRLTKIFMQAKNDLDTAVNLIIEERGAL